jgi:hypothetical protein
MELGRSHMNSGRSNWNRASQAFSWVYDLTNAPSVPLDVSSHHVPGAVGPTRDELRISALQHLGIVRRDDDPKDAKGRLYTALEHLDDRRPRLCNAPLLELNIHRDIARLELAAVSARSRGDARKAADEIDELRRLADRQPDEPMWAATMITAALMERSYGLGSAATLVSQSLPAIERIESPVLHANLLTAALKLLEPHASPELEQALVVTAHSVVAYGYQHEAAKMLEIGEISELVGGETLEQLRRLARGEPR